MPYISNDKRSILDSHIDSLYHELVGLEADDDENNMEGNLNYLLTRLLMMVYGDKNSTRYAQINDAIGMLECCKMEFYRKVAAPYEDQKEFENGEVQRSVTDVHLNTVTVENTTNVEDNIDIADQGC